MPDDDQRSLSELITLFDELDDDGRDLLLAIARRLAECADQIDAVPTP